MVYIQYIYGIYGQLCVCGNCIWYIYSIYGIYCQLCVGAGGNVYGQR